MAIAAFVALLFALQWTGVSDWLEYNRAAIASGEWWRLASWPLVHMNVSHLTYDVAGFVLCMALVGRWLCVREWLALLLFATLVMSACLWLFAPGIHWVVGISGLICTVLVVGATELWIQQPAERLLAALLLLFLVTKLAYEHFYGPLPGSVRESGGPVVVQVHLYGAIAGVIWLMGRRGWRLLTWSGRAM